MKYERFRVKYKTGDLVTFIISKVNYLKTLFKPDK